jgi:hypothetical protein
VRLQRPVLSTFSACCTSAVKRLRTCDDRASANNCFVSFILSKRAERESRCRAPATHCAMARSSESGRKVVGMWTWTWMGTLVPMYLAACCNMVRIQLQHRVTLEHSRLAGCM